MLTMVQKNILAILFSLVHVFFVLGGVSRLRHDDRGQVHELEVLAGAVQESGLVHRQRLAHRGLGPVAQAGVLREPVGEERRDTLGLAFAIKVR